MLLVINLEQTCYYSVELKPSLLKSGPVFLVGHVPMQLQIPHKKSLFSIMEGSLFYLLAKNLMRSALILPLERIVETQTLQSISLLFPLFKLISKHDRQIGQRLDLHFRTLRTNAIPSLTLIAVSPFSSWCIKLDFVIFISSPM